MPTLAEMSEAPAALSRDGPSEVMLPAGAPIDTFPWEVGSLRP